MLYGTNRAMDVYVCICKQEAKVMNKGERERERSVQGREEGREEN